MKIEKVENILDFKTCDKLLNELIIYELKFDNLTNKDFIVESFYEKFFNNDNAVLFLAKEKDIPVGYIIAYRKYIKDTSFITNIVFIDALFIKKEFRNKGIGKLLISSVETWAKEKYQDYRLELTCLIDNKLALDFYSKLGFTTQKLTLRK